MNGFEARHLASFLCKNFFNFFPKMEQNGSPKDLQSVGVCRKNEKNGRPFYVSISTEEIRKGANR